MVFSVITVVLLTLQILKKKPKYGDYVLAKFEEKRSQKFYVAIVEGVDMELELKFFRWVEPSGYVFVLNSNDNCMAPHKSCHQTTFLTNY